MGEAENCERQRHRHHSAPDVRRRLPDEVKAEVSLPQRSHAVIVSYDFDLSAREVGGA